MNLCPACGSAFDPADSGGPCPRCSLRAALGDALGGTDDGYEVISELGRGGMGVVRLARHRRLDRLVALKVIAVGTEGRDTAVARLLREARAAAALQHPHVVAVHDVGQDSDGAFIAMEYCEGGDLRARLRRGTLAPRAAAALAAKLAEAVARAHAAGVLHRDLKPSNVLLTATGEPKLADFGLAGSVAGTTGEFTRTGEVAGSPSYLAPECLSAGHVPTAAVDIYGLGAVLYECVTGRPPFTGDSAAAVLAQIPATDPVAPRRLNPDVPADLDTIILKCLEKRPSSRYGSAAELHNELSAFLAGRPIRARPLGRAQLVWRWSRRNPGLASTTAGLVLLLVVIATISTVMTVRIEEERARTAEARDRALAAEREATAQLRGALLSQARAIRATPQAGHRREALAVLARAALIRPGRDLRDEAIAALNLPEWSEAAEVKVWDDPGISTATPLPGFTAFIHETAEGVFTRRSYPGGEVVWRWADSGAPSAGQTVVSSDGRWVAVRLQDDSVHVLDAATGRTEFSLSGRPFVFKTSRIWGYGADMAFTRDGRRFAVTRPEGGVTIHELPGGRQVAAWEATEWVIALAFSHNGRWLLAGGSRDRGKNLVALVDAESGRELARDLPPSRVDFVAWSPDDRWIAVGSRPIQVRSSLNFGVRAVMPDRGALHAWFLPGGDTLVLSEQVGQTRVWDIDSGRLVVQKPDAGRPGVFFDPGPPLRQWRYFSAGRVVVQEFQPSPILVSHQPVKSGYTITDVADPVEVSADGRWCLIGGFQRPVAIAVGTGEGYPLGPPGPDGSRSVARFDPDGDAVWIGQTGGALRRHAFRIGPDGRPEVDAGEEIPGHDGFLPAALHRATGRLALTNLQTGRVRIIDARTLAPLSEWPLPRASTAVFSPDGAMILTNGEPTPDGRAEVREAATGRLVRSLGSGAGKVAAWHPAGATVVLGTSDDDLAVWRADSWERLRAVLPDVRASSALAAYSPDGRYLAVRGERLYLLRAETLEVLAAIPFPDGLRVPVALRFSPNSRQLMLARIEGRVDIWDVAVLRAELAKLELDWSE